MSDLITLNVSDREVDIHLTRLLAKGQNMRPVMREISHDMRDAVLENFEREGRPNPWKKSRRAAKQGGKTLQHTRRLMKSITPDSSVDTAGVGTNLNMLPSVDNQYIQYHPFKGLKKPFKAEKDRHRERFLSHDEIASLWAALERKDLAMTAGIKVALKLILLTAQRPSEVAGMHASEIEGSWWTIPGARTKNGKSHRVYLSQTALSLIGSIEGRGYLFPSSVGKGGRHITGNALNYALRRNVAVPVVDGDGNPVSLENGMPATENRLGVVEHFTPHDLRRTAATLLAKDKIPFEQRERVLNHSLGKLDKTYNKYDFDEERRNAAETLERRIMLIVSGTGGKVIPISFGKKAA